MKIYAKKMSVLLGLTLALVPFVVRGAADVSIASRKPITMKVHLPGDWLDRLKADGEDYYDLLTFPRSTQIISFTEQGLRNLDGLEDLLFLYNHRYRDTESFLFYLGSNNITTVDLSNFQALHPIRFIDLSHNNINQITNIGDPKKLVQGQFIVPPSYLQALDLSHNQLVDFPILTEQDMERFKRAWPALSYIDLSNNRITPDNAERLQALGAVYGIEFKLDNQQPVVAPAAAPATAPGVPEEAPPAYEEGEAPPAYTP